MDNRESVTENVVLQLTDSLTGRYAAVRIDPSDERLTLGDLLDKYLKHAPLERLIAERRITSDSAERLQDIQDYVYLSTDSGELRSMFYGVVFRQSGEEIGLDFLPVSDTTQVEDKDVKIIDIEIDRIGVGNERNWTGFNQRRWDRHSDVYADYVESSFASLYPANVGNRILQRQTPEDRHQFLRIVAHRIWDSPFENYSRFVGEKILYKTGDETLRNMIAGNGGICAEKISALKFLTDQYGFESEYVVAGANAKAPVPEDRLRELLTTFDFRMSKRYMRYWQHVALLYHLDGQEILVDVTNGNIPFLFAVGSDAERLLSPENQQPLPVCMAVQREDFYYNRVSKDIPELLYYAMENWFEDVDLIQVFDNELGLCITPDFFVTPVVYKSEKAFEELKNQYAEAFNRAGMPYDISPDWSLDGEQGQRFEKTDSRAAKMVIDARDHLLSRYDDTHGEGHEAGLAVVSLRGRNEDVSSA